MQAKGGKVVESEGADDPTPREAIVNKRQDSRLKDTAAGGAGSGQQALAGGWGPLGLAFAGGWHWLGG